MSLGAFWHDTVEMESMKYPIVHWFSKLSLHLFSVLDRSISSYTVRLTQNRITDRREI